MGAVTLARSRPAYELCLVDQTTDEKGRWLRQGSVGKSGFACLEGFLHAWELHQRKWGDGWAWEGCDGGMGLGGGMDGCFSALLIFSASGSCFFLGFLGVWNFSPSEFSVCLLSLVMDGDGPTWGLDGLGKGEEPHAYEGAGVWMVLTLLYLEEEKIPVSMFFSPVLVPAWVLWFVAHRCCSAPPFPPIGGDSALFRQRMPPFNRCG
jgi:hypothetical protein